MDEEIIVQRVMAAVAAGLAATRAVQALGDSVWVVGGAVRDAAAGHEPKDVDLMVVGMTPEDLQERLSPYGSLEYHGRDFPVWRFFYGDVVEIALARVERSVGNGHKDFAVQYDRDVTVEQDLARRDYTVNAMAVRSDGFFLDPYDGMADIESGAIRAVSATTIADDPLRTLRAFVLISRYGWSVEPSTWEAIVSNAARLDDMARERVQWEMDKLIAGEFPSSALFLMDITGVLEYVFPELAACMGWSQNNRHHELDLGEHCLSVLDHVARVTSDVDVRYAAVAHDWGKRSSVWRDPVTGSSHFYRKYVDDCVVGPVAVGAQHEDVSAEMVRERFRALYFPRDRINRIATLVQYHMWAGFTNRRGARRFLAVVGDHADDLLDIRYGDNGGKHVYPVSVDQDLLVQRKLVREVREASEATTVRMLAINGDDLIRAGWKPGPRMGVILRSLLDMVVDDPALNTYEDLIEAAGIAN